MRPISLLGTAALLIMATACNGGGGDDTAVTGDDTGPTGASFEDFINVTTPMIIADDACWTAGDDWLTETPDPVLQTLDTLTAEVNDFESGDRVTGLLVELYSTDDVTGTADMSGESDQNGEITFDEVPVCAPTGYKTSSPDGETKDTYESHQFYEPGTGDGITGEFNSVSRVTFLIIPSLLGISPDPTASIIAGTAYDCNDDPVEGMQVVVKVNGVIPDGLITKYFVDDFPNRDQPHTSEDGLWIAINVPPGEATVEMWGVPPGGGDVQLYGSTVLPTFADSINVANIPFGHDNGVKYPAACLTPAR